MNRALPKIHTNYVLMKRLYKKIIISKVSSGKLNQVRKEAKSN